MRFRLALCAVLLLSITSLPAISQYQWGRPKPPQTGACFYRDLNFTGDYFCMKVGANWPSMPSGFNDRITSIRLFRGAQVRVFNSGNFRGVNSRITRDAPDLRRLRLPDNPSKNWDDRISSIAVYVANDSWDRSHP